MSVSSFLPPFGGKSENHWKDTLLSSHPQLSVISLCFFLLWPHLRSSEDSDVAYVTWETLDKSMTAYVSVIDEKGKPVEDVEVVIVNNSGGNPGITDSNGLAIIEVGESDVESLSIAGTNVVHRPFSYWLGTPNMRKGLYFRIHLKGPLKDLHVKRYS